MPQNFMLLRHARLVNRKKKTGVRLCPKHFIHSMFDNLSEKLQRGFKNLRGEGKLSAANMETALREIRVALLEADGHFRVVKQLIENIKQKALGEQVLTALSPTPQVLN